MIATLLCVFFFVAALAWGRLILKFVPSVCQACSTLEQGVFGVATGLGVLSFFAFFFGCTGLLLAESVWVILGGGVLMALGDLKRFLPEMVVDLYQTLRDMPRFLTCILGGLLSVHLFFNFIACFAPPAEMDALMNHLAVPKVYITHQEFVDIPSHIHSYLPFAIQMLFALALLVWGDILAVLLHYGMGLTLVGAVFALCVRWFRPEVGLLAAVCFYTLPMVTNLATTPLVDFGLSLFTFLSLYAFLIWAENSDNHNTIWLGVAGLFAGLALCVKYIAGVHIVVLSVFVLYRCYTHKKSLSQITISLISFWLVAAVVACPWYFKTWILVGNPIFPIGYGLLGGKYWNETVDAINVMRTTQIVSPLGNSLLDFLVSPWRITMEGSKINAGPNGYGPLFLVFLPFVFVGGIYRKTVVRYGLIHALGFFTFLFFVFQYGRWFLPIVPWLCIVVASVIFVLADLSKVLKVSVIGVLCVTLGFHFGVNVIYNKKFVPVVLGMESRDDYLKVNTWNYEAYQYVNQHTSVDSKVLLWCWYSPYYLDRDYVIGQPTRQGFIDYRQFEDVTALLKFLQKLGITHIIWDYGIVPKDGYNTIDYQGMPDAIDYLSHFGRLKDDLRSHHLKSLYVYSEQRFMNRTMRQNPYTSPLGVYEIDFTSIEN